MRPELCAIASRNGGVFTRRDAVTSGYTERELKTLTSRPGGAWVVVRRGVYVDRSLWDAVDEDGRYRFGVLAAALVKGRDSTISHTAAAAMHRMPLRPRWRDLVHVTRPDARGGRTEAGVKHHVGSLDARDVVEIDSQPVTGLARTALDIGREVGFEDGVVATDAALRMGARREDLVRGLASMWCWPGVTRARAAVRVADAGAANPGESLLRLLVLELGIGRPETQVEFRENGRRAFVDLKVGRHLFEFDGRTKYLTREQGGVADRPPEDVVWEEKRREDWLRRVGGGHGMSRVIWPELLGAARARTRDRLAAEYAETVRRYGRAA